MKKFIKITCIICDGVIGALVNNVQWDVCKAAPSPSRPDDWDKQWRY